MSSSRKVTPVSGDMIVDLIVPQNRSLDLGGSIHRNVSIVRKIKGSTCAGIELAPGEASSLVVSCSSSGLLLVLLSLPPSVVESSVAVVLILVAIMNR